MIRLSWTSLLTAMWLIVPTVAIQAQDSTWGWSDAAELSFVFTGGNASASTLGLKNTLTGEGGVSKLILEVGGIRTESTVRTRFATGTATNFTVTDSSVSDLTAESYFARARYDYSISEQGYWFTGSKWNRNTFSGIDHRITFVSGLGGIWVDTDDFKFETDLGVTYTFQDNVAEGPTDRFGGLQFTYDLMRQVSSTTTFASKLILDENLKDTEDFRGDWTNALTVAISSRLALKTSLQILFDNQPSFLDVPLIEGGVDLGNTVAAQLDKVDSVVTVALVVNF